ncbi:MAG TPA: hypothetical protein PKD68_04225 [Candidatus Saccharibacteria bacterium]|nr:hypothetical protein [Candidatus Saccharibacteria bacterium]
MDIILHSGGGSPGDAYRLIRTFREHYKIVNVVVPFWAKSAATLFTFGATKIVMQEYGELGPIDAQIRKDDEEKPREEWESALNIQSSLLKIEELSNRNFVDLFINLQHNPDINIGRKQLAEMLLSYNSNLYAPLLQRVEVYEMGRMERYLSIGKMYARRIITQYGEISGIDPEKAEELLDFLTYECPDHGYIVDYSLLSKYLPNVIRSSCEPFGAEYDKVLEELSLLLMVGGGDITMVDFVNNIVETQTRKNNVTRSEEERNDSDRIKEQAAIKDSQPGSESAKNSHKKESQPNKK